MNAIRTDQLPRVDATLNYLGRTDERPRNYTYEPPPGVPRSNTVRDPHVVPIHDARAVADDVSLDREGFALIHAASAVKNFWDEDEVRRVYYPEVQRVIAEATGASKVFIFDHTLRRRVKDTTDRTTGAPRHPPPVCMLITPRHPARNEYATSSAMRPKRSCAAGWRSSICGGRSVVLCVTRRWRCAMRRLWLPRTWCRLT